MRIDTGNLSLVEYKNGVHIDQDKKLKEPEIKALLFGRNKDLDNFVSGSSEGHMTRPARKHKSKGQELLQAYNANLKSNGEVIANIRIHPPHDNHDPYFTLKQDDRAVKMKFLHGRDESLKDLKANEQVESVVKTVLESLQNFFLL